MAIGRNLSGLIAWLMCWQRYKLPINDHAMLCQASSLLLDFRKMAGHNAPNMYEY